MYGVFSCSYFPVFGLNTEIYGVNLRIQSEYRKIQTRKNSVFGHSSRSVQIRLKEEFLTFCMDYFLLTLDTAQKMKFSIKDFFSKCDQILRKLRICSYLLKKSLIENFIFCAVGIKLQVPLIFQ